MNLPQKSALLEVTLRHLGSLLVAYSGGTDSAYLAYAAHRALGDSMLAVRPNFHPKAVTRRRVPESLRVSSRPA